MSWKFLGNCLFSSIWIFVGLALAGLLYKFVSNTNKLNSEKDVRFAFTIGIIGIVELTFSVGFAISGIYKAFYSIHHSAEAAAELTGAVATVATIISTVFGLLFKNKQDKIQKLHSESGWRKELLDLESNDSYSFKDLFKLNTFINPYHTDNNDIDYLVNFAIVTIINNHTKNSDWVDKNFKRFFTLVNQSSIDKKIKDILLPNYSLPNLFDIEFQEKLTDEKKESDKENDSETTKLTDIENSVIHKCIHALLKNDWE